MNILSIGPPGLDASGYGEMQRRILLALEDSGWKVTLRPFNSLNIAIEDTVNESRLRQMEESPLPPPGSPLLFFGPALLFKPHPDYYNIGFTMAEADHVSREWVNNCNKMNEVWVPSRFNYDIFISCGVRPEILHIMHLGVDTQHFKPAKEPRSATKFTFLSCFELVPRKGCDILMEAFCEEFEPAEPVELIIKSFENWGKHDPQGGALSGLLHYVQKKYNKRPSMILEKCVIPYSQLPALYNSVDCQISASHGEGWNLPLMEAMACRVPVIALNWSGHTEYLTAENSFPVKVTGFIMADAPIYPGARWAAADKNSLRRMMRYVVEHPLEVKQKGNRARRDVVQNYSIKKIAQDISLRLEHCNSTVVRKKTFDHWIKQIIKQFNQLPGKEDMSVNKQYINRLSELDHLLKTKYINSSEEQKFRELCNIFYKLPNKDEFSVNPFSDNYFEKVKHLLLNITETESYSPETNELTPSASTDDWLRAISPYNFSESDFVGEFISTYGLIIKGLQVKSDDSILEYGAGTGGISVPLARMGCKVSVVDIEPRYLDIIKKQCDMYKIEIRLKKGLFGENINKSDRYDRILFFESFHHWLDHQKGLRDIGLMLNENGKIYFTGEPVISSDSFFKDACPFPWGPRLDGLSLHAMREYGWCELGFREDYFIHLLLRNGFTVRKILNTQNNRATIYIAENNKGIIDISKGHLLNSCTKGQKWHEPERQFLWTSACSNIPLDQKNCWRKIEIKFRNSMPFPRNVHLLSNKEHFVQIAAGSKQSIALDLVECPEEISIICDPFVPAKAIQGSKDTRRLGIAVEQIRYS